MTSLLLAGYYDGQRDPVWGSKLKGVGDVSCHWRNSGGNLETSQGGRTGKSLGSGAQDQAPSDHGLYGDWLVG